jgi:transposase
MMPRAASLPEVSSLEEARGVILSIHGELQQALWRVQQLEKELFGASSERQVEGDRLSREQKLLELFPAPSAPPATEDVLLPAEDQAASPPRARRQPAIKVLETVTERLEPAEKVCARCGREKCEIGCEKSERFEYVPAKIIRHEILRPKLACPCGQSGVSIAPLPPSIIEQGQPGPALVAHVILTKFADHVPLERQRQQFERLGVYFPRSTLCDWVEKGASWLEPIARLMKQELVRDDYLQVDETPVKVLDPDVKGQCARGWLWVIGRPQGDVVFEFHPGRGKAEAQALLGGFQGYLQRDGYGVYGSLAKDNPGLIPVGCWAHARRKFIEGQEEEPALAIPIIAELRKLYLIERQARDQNLGPPERAALRQEKSLPILKALQPVLESLQARVLPQSPLGKAARYCLAEWEPLQRYLSHGRLEIDNNLTENAIRPSAVGKKNWLFIGHPKAGWRSAVIYSIIVSCRRRGIEPWEYLKDVFKRLPAMKQSELPSLLPAHWKPA